MSGSIGQRHRSPAPENGAVEAGRTAVRILRADSQFYNAGVLAAGRRAGARFSIACGNVRVIVDTEGP
ncbi:hypothetical protein AB0C96_04485 [Streptomyces sp. NPDC048506]|uniref:hypothetical protein n=1 Tax=Streptomyces sp. NPDC048506 TaxID=3155028 RepID=UPI003428AA35